MAFISALALWAALFHFALALTSQVTPLESRPNLPRPGSCVNSPQSRGCWKGDFDIYTDYDTTIPQGRVREVCGSLSRLLAPLTPIDARWMSH